jgi:hypothetical protein
MSGGRVCVGDIDHDSGVNLRLLAHDGMNVPVDHPIRPGEIWKVTCTPRRHVRPPHVEDVLVTSGKRLEIVPDMKGAVLNLVQPWECDLDSIFDSRMATTSSGTAFVRDEFPLPSGSTGFWITKAPVHIARSEDRGVRYWFPEGSKIRSAKYVGMEEPMPAIPAAAVIRFSLARWAVFPPGVDEERCYLQVSGSYS